MILELQYRLPSFVLVVALGTAPDQSLLRDTQLKVRTFWYLDLQRAVTEVARSRLGFQLEVPLSTYTQQQTSVAVLALIPNPKQFLFIIQVSRAI
jgi:hypothetical protein